MRAWAIEAAAQDHRDTADVSHERVEAAEGQGAPAQENGNLPSSRASLSEQWSSEKSRLMPKVTAAVKADDRP